MRKMRRPQRKARRSQLLYAAWREGELARRVGLTLLSLPSFILRAPSRCSCRVSSGEIPLMGAMRSKRLYSLRIWRGKDKKFCNRRSFFWSVWPGAPVKSFLPSPPLRCCPLRPRRSLFGQKWWPASAFPDSVASGTPRCWWSPPQRPPWGRETESLSV